MKQIIGIIIFCFAFVLNARSQTTASQGKAIGEIFTDFHLNLNDTSKTTGFGINRAHLGYNYLPGNNFSATIIVNIGSPDELADGAKHRRYAYFKEASVAWSKDNLNISAGITKTRLFDFQQKFWGKRYLADTYQSINGYGFVSDLGITADYKINDIIKTDFTLMNGEGYSELQLDNNLRTSLGITITPVKELAIRIYGDISKPHGVYQNTLIGFVGFKNDLITIGGEVSYKSNLDMTGGHDAWGISGTGGITVIKNTELFVRYDYSSSVIVPGDVLHWNYKMDGSFTIIGVQYSFTENIKTALNYQGINPYNPGRSNSDAIYVNALFRF